MNFMIKNINTTINNYCCTNIINRRPFRAKISFSKLFLMIFLMNKIKNVFAARNNVSYESVVSLADTSDSQEHSILKLKSFYNNSDLKKYITINQYQSLLQKYHLVSRNTGFLIKKIEDFKKILPNKTSNFSPENDQHIFMIGKLNVNVFLNEFLDKEELEYFVSHNDLSYFEVLKEKILELNKNEKLRDYALFINKAQKIFAKDQTIKKYLCDIYQSIKRILYLCKTHCQYLIKCYEKFISNVHELKTKNIIIQEDEIGIENFKIEYRQLYLEFSKKLFSSHYFILAAIHECYNAMINFDIFLYEVVSVYSVDDLSFDSNIFILLSLNYIKNGPIECKKNFTSVIQNATKRQFEIIIKKENIKKFNKKQKYKISKRITFKTKEKIRRKNLK